VRATLDRAELSLRRLFSAGRMVIYYHDFPTDSFPLPLDSLPTDLSVQRKNRLEEIEQRDLDRIVNYWNPELAQRQLEERFKAGASLWLIRCEGQVAGYGWTLAGRTMRSYFVPFGADDVHLFDFLVFPEYRGRRVNPTLVSYILAALTQEGKSRAYIEAAEWNQAELKSLGRTTFHLLGRARKTAFLGRTIVEWRTEQMQNVRSGTEQNIS